MLILAAQLGPFVVPRLACFGGQCFLISREIQILGLVSQSTLYPETLTLVVEVKNFTTEVWRVSKSDASFFSTLGSRENGACYKTTDDFPYGLHMGRQAMSCHQATTKEAMKRNYD